MSGYLGKGIVEQICGGLIGGKSRATQGGCIRPDNITV